MITIQIRNDAAELARLETMLRSLAQEHRLTDYEKSTLRLVLEEIVTNVISYAHDDDADHEILIRVSIAEHQIPQGGSQEFVVAGELATRNVLLTRGGARRRGFHGPA